MNNYWVRAIASSGVGSLGIEGGVNAGILRYQGAPDADPTTTNQTDVIALTESMLHPLVNPAAPGEPYPGGADVVLNMSLGFALPATFTINGAQYLPPVEPVLLQILSGAHTAQELLPAGSVYPLPLNSTIEINLDGGSAPSGPVRKPLLSCIHGLTEFFSTHSIYMV